LVCDSFAIATRFVCVLFWLRFGFGLVALILYLIRGFNSSRIPLLAIMFVRQFAQFGDRETIRVSRKG